ncbi:MAG: hypothetical protein LBV37_00310 [Mycoplasmataceae bacterium]|nr:hypothetical protein [Mycoplasmataceae bacterium]
MNEYVGFWKTNGNHADKFYVTLSFMLIYPIFRFSKHEQEIVTNINVLSKYRENLLEIVLCRKELLKSFYRRYKRKLKPNIDKLCLGLMQRNVFVYSMNKLELEIEGFHHVIQDDADSDKKMVSYLNETFLPSEKEFNALTHAYNSLYQAILVKNRRFPWNILLKFLRFKELDLRY